ncbi:hypothetical protein [Nocardioides sp. KR10-350]|uniref:hypothetical protein n=1 Tax=Nocardioides cheoyonin TaxID=3156615 RepID=UPI0032B4C532
MGIQSYRVVGELADGEALKEALRLALRANSVVVVRAVEIFNELAARRGDPAREFVLAITSTGFSYPEPNSEPEQFWLHDEASGDTVTFWVMHGRSELMIIR